MWNYSDLIGTIWWPEELRLYETYLRTKIIRKFIRKENIRWNILDFWCGFGYWSFFVLDLIKSWKVIGLETDADAIQIADKYKRTHNRQNIEFYSYDWRNLPRFNYEFDCVLAISVFLCLNKLWIFKQIFQQIDKDMKKWWKIIIIELFKKTVFEWSAFKTFLFDDFVSFFRDNNYKIVSNEAIYYSTLSRYYLSFVQKYKFLNRMRLLRYIPFLFDTIIDFFVLKVFRLNIWERKFLVFEKK